MSTATVMTKVRESVRLLRKSRLSRDGREAGEMEPSQIAEALMDWPKIIFRYETIDVELAQYMDRTPEEAVSIALEEATEQGQRLYRDLPHKKFLILWEIGPWDESPTLADGMVFLICYSEDSNLVVRRYEYCEEEVRSCPYKMIAHCEGWQGHVPRNYRDRIPIHGEGGVVDAMDQCRHAVDLVLWMMDCKDVEIIMGQEAPKGMTAGGKPLKRHLFKTTRFVPQRRFVHTRGPMTVERQKAVEHLRRSHLRHYKSGKTVQVKEAVINKGVGGRKERIYE